jgi:hypothetical protein
LLISLFVGVTARRVLESTTFCPIALGEFDCLLSI